MKDSRTVRLKPTIEIAILQIASCSLCTSFGCRRACPESSSLITAIMIDPMMSLAIPLGTIETTPTGSYCQFKEVAAVEAFQVLAAEAAVLQTTAATSKGLGSGMKRASLQPLRRRYRPRPLSQVCSGTGCCSWASRTKAFSNPVCRSSSLLCHVTEGRTPGRALGLDVGILC